MDDKKFNFNLGNRKLTPSESVVVDKAKTKLRESLTRHAHDGSVVTASAIFKATATVTAAAAVTRARGTDVVSGKPDIRDFPPKGTDVLVRPPRQEGSGDTENSKWRTTKAAPAARRY